MCLHELLYIIMRKENPIDESMYHGKIFGDRKMDRKIPKYANSLLQGTNVCQKKQNCLLVSFIV